MPFTPRDPDSNPSPAPRSNNANDAPLLRLGGMWTSKSGKAIMSNVFVHEPRRVRPGEQTERTPFGDILIDMIKQCMEEKRPLRFLVFENDREGGKTPYSLHATLGNAQTDTAPQNGRSAPREKAQSAQSQKGGAVWTPQVPLPSEDDEDESDPEPVPRPTRRTAPRR